MLRSSKNKMCLGAALTLGIFALSETAQANEPTVDVPSGTYVLDPNHTTLSFKVGHIGLSTYIARFTGVTSTIELSAENLLDSSVELNVDPLSIKADYAGTYRDIYPNTEFEGWDEHLAKDKNFFDAGTFPSVSFSSASIVQTGENTGKVLGELSLLGKTLPLEMDVTLNGALAQHPFIKGFAVLGVSATGTIKRSDFGMTFLLEPPFVSDDVVIEFEAEYIMPATEK